MSKNTITKEDWKIFKKFCKSEGLVYKNIKKYFLSRTPELQRYDLINMKFILDEKAKNKALALKSLKGGEKSNVITTEKSL